MATSNKQLIISIGTGRSGSVSLSKFLTHQKYMRVLHEGKIEEAGIRKLIKWKNDEEELFKWLEFLEKHNTSNIFYGDTGMYYLPYITKIIKKYPNVKIIGLIREKNEVVNSYMKKTEGRNHWYNHDGVKWEKDEKWDHCYPNYDEKNKKKALELYWDEYKKETEKLEYNFSNNIKIWTIEEFNTTKGKNEILDFINYNFKRDTSSNFKLNTIQKETLLQKIKKKWF